MALKTTKELLAYVYEDDKHRTYVCFPNKLFSKHTDDQIKNIANKKFKIKKEQLKVCCGNLKGKETVIVYRDQRVIAAGKLIADCRLVYKG